MKDFESVTSFLSRCWNQDRLYLLVWTGTLIVVGGLLTASRAYPDGSIDPELMNLWIVWSIILVLVNFLAEDLRFIVGIQLLLVLWLTIRLRFNRIAFGRFLLAMTAILLLFARTSTPRFLIFVAGLFYLWQHQRFSVRLPVSSIGGPIHRREDNTGTTEEDGFPRDNEEDRGLFEVPRVTNPNVLLDGSGLGIPEAIRPRWEVV